MPWEETDFSNSEPDEDMGGLFEWPVQGEDEQEHVVNWITRGILGCLVKQEIVTNRWSDFMSDIDTISLATSSFGDEAEDEQESKGEEQHVSESLNFESSSSQLQTSIFSVSENQEGDGEEERRLFEYLSSELLKTQGQDLGLSLNENQQEQEREEEHNICEPTSLELPNSQPQATLFSLNENQDEEVVEKPTQNLPKPDSPLRSRKRLVAIQKKRHSLKKSFKADKSTGRTLRSSFAARKPLPRGCKKISTTTLKCM
ncbi:hypothetical protein DL95DRAFT_413348 [Leptodontidium sp. 2 PMI_412]|nr:hypothetical protein DL95DRAFT_413348 [Leptodontidium sp. 2 PMI_412]